MTILLGLSVFTSSKSHWYNIVIDLYIIFINNYVYMQGATVKCGKNGKVLISRVLHGGAADKSGVYYTLFPTLFGSIT